MSVKHYFANEDADGEESPKTELKRIIPAIGTLEWIAYLQEIEGHLPTPINVSITGATRYKCPDLRWFNFNIFPHKVKITNTGYTVILGAKWKAERPFLLGGPLSEKHILSEVHFHWGRNMTEGSDHTVDNQAHPGEMQVTFFKMDYMTQEEAFRHPDGVLMMCFLIKYGVQDDKRLEWVLEGFPRIKEANTNTRIGPQPMSHLIPTFFEDYFLYWGTLKTVAGDNFVCKWIVSRQCLFASDEQMKKFRKLWDPWDKPYIYNFRPLQEVSNRHILFMRPHWSQYNSLLPCDYMGTNQDISEMSECYVKNPHLLPQQNVDLIPVAEDEIFEIQENMCSAKQISKMKASQSPIAISSQRCLTWSSLDPLKYKGYWDNQAKGTLLNTGQTAYFTFDTSVCPRVSGGPLIGEYIFEQMHFHWSVDDYTGCEHVLDGQAECHFVHFNSKYPSKEVAVGYPDGLAVVGFLLEAVDAPNPRFDRLVKGFKSIKKKGQAVKVTSESLSWMARDELEDGSYVTYKGSLTTPPYTECVTWIIYEKPVSIGTEQLGLLRQLEGHNDTPIERNVRPTQRHPPGHSVIYVKQVKAKL